jgi:pimeloyl-ACP methyl ester carboxylesterase
MKKLSYFLACFTFFLTITSNSIGQSGNVSDEKHEAFDSAVFFKMFTSKMADINGIRLHYVIGGKGPLIVLIHGWPENWYEWRKVMPLLSSNYTVISVDVRGAGQSSVTDSGYDKKTLAADIHALVASLGYKTAIITGHDWGAGVAYAYAAQFGSEVNHLVVCEGIPFGKWVPKTNLFWFFDLIRIPDYYAESLTTGREKEFLHYFYQRPTAHFNKEAIDSNDENYYIRYFVQPGHMTAGFGFYRTIDQDVIDNNRWSMNPLQMPVLAIGADLQSKDDIAKVMKNLASNVQQLVMQNTGHFAPEDRPHELVEIILRFLKK